MPHTIIEKIFLAHGAESAEPGSIQWLGLDYRTARDFGGASVVQEPARARRGQAGRRPQSARSSPSTATRRPTPRATPTTSTSAACSPASTASRSTTSTQGIGSHVLIESGLIKPGTTAVGTDSHYNILGALGAFGQGMGDLDIAYAFAHGRTWFEVPPVGEDHPHGHARRQRLRQGRDAARRRPAGRGGAARACVGEVYGEWIDQADVASRITLASMGTEMGAISIIIPGDDPDFHAGSGAPHTSARWRSTSMACARRWRCPGHPEDVHPVHEVIARAACRSTACSSAAAPTGASRTCARRLSILQGKRPGRRR